MLRVAVGRTLSYILAGWFVVAFALITVAGIGFLGTLLYNLAF